MSGGFSHEMNSRIKNNANLRKKRKRYFEVLHDYRDTLKGKELKFKDMSESEKLSFRLLIKQRAKKRLIVRSALVVFWVLGTLGLFYWVSKIW